MGTTPLGAFVTTPIPQSAVADTASYRSVPVDLSDARSMEPLFALDRYRIQTQPFYARCDGQNAPYFAPVRGSTDMLRARRGVCERLAMVNAALVPHCIELLVLDAHRTHECQTGLWEFFMAQGREQLGANAPFEQVVEFARRFCSDPRGFNPQDPKTWFVHGTGGAVDVTLVLRGTSEQLYMGGIFDDPSERSESAYYERRASRGDALDLSEQEALRNRRMLYHAMLAGGFSNYGPEWWHFDYGDPLWALAESSRSGTAVAAFYGAVQQ